MAELITRTSEKIGRGINICSRTVTKPFFIFQDLSRSGNIVRWVKTIMKKVIMVTMIEHISAILERYFDRFDKQRNNRSKMDNMHYDQYIQELVDVLKADKSIVQPWRNYAIKHFQEGLADVHMGKTTTNRELDGNLPETTCTCPPGGIKRTCPLHGTSGGCICTELGQRK